MVLVIIGGSRFAFDSAPWRVWVLGFGIGRLCFAGRGAGNEVWLTMVVCSDSD